MTDPLHVEVTRMKHEIERLLLQRDHLAAENKRLWAIADAAKTYKALDDKRWEDGIQTVALHPAWADLARTLAALPERKNP